jgi:hypothetical protein
VFELCQLCSISQREQNIWGSGRVCYLLGEDRGEVAPSWNVMADGDAREGKWRGNWQMVWVASTLHTTSEHGISSSYYIWCAHFGCHQSTELTPPTDLNGLICFAKKTKSVFCACAVTFQTRSASSLWTDADDCSQWTGCYELSLCTPHCVLPFCTDL